MMLSNFRQKCVAPKCLLTPINFNKGKDQQLFLSVDRTVRTIHFFPQICLKQPISSLEECLVTA